MPKNEDSGTCIEFVHSELIYHSATFIRLSTGNGVKLVAKLVKIVLGIDAKIRKTGSTYVAALQTM